MDRFAKLSFAEKLKDKKGILDAAKMVVFDVTVHLPIIYFPTYYTVKEFVGGESWNPIDWVRPIRCYFLQLYCVCFPSSDSNIVFDSFRNNSCAGKGWCIEIRYQRKGRSDRHDQAMGTFGLHSVCSSHAHSVALSPPCILLLDCVCQFHAWCYDSRRNNRGTESLERERESNPALSDISTALRVCSNKQNKNLDITSSNNDRKSNYAFKLVVP